MIQEQDYFERRIWHPTITWSGWRDLNSRPLDPQIGPPQISGVNYLSLVSMVDR
jgi:hypothetical protein